MRLRLPGAISWTDAQAMRESLWDEIERQHRFHRGEPQTWKPGPWFALTPDIAPGELAAQQRIERPHRPLRNPHERILPRSRNGLAMRMFRPRVCTIGARCGRRSATRWQAPRPMRGSHRPSCGSDVGGRAESAAGQIGTSYARKAGSPCGANQ
jgi:hypothetical protein